MNAIIIAIAAQVVACAALVFWTRAKVRSSLGSGAELERIRREIGALMAELDASADRNITVLEDRLSALKELVATADRRIASLDKELTRRQAEASVYDRLGRFSGPPGEARPAAELAPSARPAPPPQTQPYTQASQPASQPPYPQASQQALPQASRQQRPEPPAAEPSASIPFIRFSEKPLPIEEPFADKVLSLSRRGFSSDIIAARLKATMAEVDLVLSLEQERRGRQG